jgi:hypothetical protein
LIAVASLALCNACSRRRNECMSHFESLVAGPSAYKVTDCRVYGADWSTEPSVSYTVHGDVEGWRRALGDESCGMGATPSAGVARAMGDNLWFDYAKMRDRMFCRRDRWLTIVLAQNSATYWVKGVPPR